MCTESFDLSAASASSLVHFPTNTVQYFCITNIISNGYADHSQLFNCNSARVFIPTIEKII